MPHARTLASYRRISRGFHWTTALLILTLLPLGAVAARLPHGTIVLVPLGGGIDHAAAAGAAPIWWPVGQSLPFAPNRSRRRRSGRRPPHRKDRPT